MIEIRPLRPGTDAATLAAFEAQFSALYAGMAGQGLADTLVEDGARRWSASMLPLLGRLTFVLGAWRDDQLVGFVGGRLSTLPDHLGGARIGSLTHIYVHPDARGHQCGERLFRSLAETFKQKGAVRMEIDVLSGNTGGQAFFERMGAHPHHLLLHAPL